VALEQMRKRKQMIYWITAILVIPSFILVWGVGGRSMSGQTHADPTVALIGGEEIGYGDFSQFQDASGAGRLPAALGCQGVRIQIEPYLLRGVMPDVDAYSGRQQFDLVFGRVSTALALAMLKQAERLGLDASDSEVSTYIHQRPQFFGIDPKDQARFEKAYRAMLKSMRISNAEYIRGVREWLIIKKLVRVMDESVPVVPDDAYVHFAQERMRCTYQKLEVRVTQAMREQAFNDLYGVKDGQPDEARINQAVEAFLAEHPKDRRFWAQPKWRLEGVLAPFDALPVEVTTAQVKAHFEENKHQYKDKTLDEVFEKIQETLKKERQKENAQRTLRVDLMSFLRRRLAENAAVTLADVDTELVKQGVKTGTSGEKAVGTDTLKLAPEIGDSADLLSFLKQIDEMEDVKGRDEAIQRLQKHFDDRQEPFACKAGLFRIRLLEYTPSEPRPLRDAKGAVDAQLRVLVADELHEQAASKAARTVAEECAAKLKDGETQAFDALASETKSYRETRQGLRDVQIGDPQIFPLYGDGKITGYEVLMLTQREAPGREAFDALAPDERARYLEQAAWRWQGTLMEPWGRPYAMIIPGPVLGEWLTQEIKAGRIRVTFPPPTKRESEPEPEPDSDY